MDDWEEIEGACELMIRILAGYEVQFEKMVADIHATRRGTEIIHTGISGTNCADTAFSPKPAWSI